jgi:hypothetical protein
MAYVLSSSPVPPDLLKNGRVVPNWRFGVAAFLPIDPVLSIRNACTWRKAGLWTAYWQPIRSSYS